MRSSRSCSAQGSVPKGVVRAVMASTRQLRSRIQKRHLGVMVGAKQG